MTTRSLLFAVVIMSCRLVWADAIYDVSLQTSALIGHPAGPFALELQFNDGSGTGDANNTATLSDFALAGGSASGPTTTFGGVAGTIGTSVTMIDSSFFNQFTEGFTPGTSLSFQLKLTTNLDSGGVPDEFSLSILDSSGVEIPTLGPANAFLIMDIDSDSPSTFTFASDTSQNPNAGGPPIAIGAPILTTPSSQVPEPKNWLLVAIGLSGLLNVRKTWLSLQRRA
jgi:hypothetical protein